jgi:hypothetical protein
VVLCQLVQLPNSVEGREVDSSCSCMADLQCSMCLFRNGGLGLSSWA